MCGRRIGPSTAIVSCSGMLMARDRLPVTLKTRPRGALWIHLAVALSIGCAKQPRADAGVIDTAQPAARAPEGAPSNAIARAPNPRVVEPSIRDTDDSLSGDGFPAVSEDGKLVAVTNRREDGARSNANLTVAIRRVDDDAV